MSLFATIFKEQGAYVDGAHKVIDSPYDNIALGALGCAIKQSNPSNPNSIINAELLARIEKSWGRDADIIEHKTGQPTFVNARSFTVAANQNTSQLLAVTMKYFGFNVIVPKQMFLNRDGSGLNMVSFQKDMMKKMQAGMNGMKEDMEDTILAAMKSSKTKIVRRPLDFEFVGDSLIATNSQREEILLQINPIEIGNNFNANEYLDIVGTVGVDAIARGLVEQGEQNAVNKAIRLKNKDIWLTNSISPIPGKFASFFAVPDGSIGIVTGTQPLCRAGEKTKDWDFYQIDGSQWGVPYNIEVREFVGGADSSADTGNPRDVTDSVVKMQLGIEYAVITPIESGSLTVPSPIIECQINTAATDNDVTAPLLQAVTSPNLTEVTIEFDSVISTTEDGGTLLSDTDESALIGSFDFTEVTPGAVISGIAVSADNTAVVLTIANTGSLAAADTVNILADKFYDVAGNKLAAVSAAQVNAGATAWEAIP